MLPLSKFSFHYYYFLFLKRKYYSKLRSLIRICLAIQAARSHTICRWVDGLIGVDIQNGPMRTIKLVLPFCTCTLAEEIARVWLLPSSEVHVALWFSCTTFYTFFEYANKFNARYFDLCWYSSTRFYTKLNTWYI